MDSKIQKRKLGKSNLEVSALGLGCMGMSFGEKVIRRVHEVQAVTAQRIIKNQGSG